MACISCSQHINYQSIIGNKEKLVGGGAVLGVILFPIVTFTLSQMERLQKKNYFHFIVFLYILLWTWLWNAFIILASFIITSVHILMIYLTNICIWSGVKSILHFFNWSRQFLKRCAQFNTHADRVILNVNVCIWFTSYLKDFNRKLKNWKCEQLWIQFTCLIPCQSVWHDGCANKKRWSR